MRIVIDLQGAQTSSRLRGIGRYSLSLARAIARNRKDHEVMIALNALFPETLAPIRAEFEGLLPGENILVWSIHGPVSGNDPSNAARRKTAEYTREAFLASLRPDVVYVTSLFEGYLDDAVTSLGLFDGSIPTVVTLYDLIPLLDREIYLDPDPLYERYYLDKIKYLERASAWFAISDCSARDGVDRLAIPEKAVAVVPPACDPIFRRMRVTGEEGNSIRRRFGLSRPFAMYSGGSYPRKNLGRLVSAYASIHSSVRCRFQLAIVGDAGKRDMRVLEKIALSGGMRREDLVFTGHVSDKELALLYNLCELFVFPSFREGFGLPVLEAICCGAPVIGADSSSLPEVIGLEEALFDPFDEEDISGKIVQGLTDAAFRSRLTSNGIVRAGSFSWDKSACEAVAFLERSFPEKGIPFSPGMMEGIERDLVKGIAGSAGNDLSKSDLVGISRSIARNRLGFGPRQLFVDVSNLVNNDGRTGNPRVTRSILMALLDNPPENCRIEPVYATGKNPGYYYARSFERLRHGKISTGGSDLSKDVPIEVNRGDVFLGLGFCPKEVMIQAYFLADIHRFGVEVHFVVYDLLPVLMADRFPPGSRDIHVEWLRIITRFGGAICISRSVADELQGWLAENAPDRLCRFAVKWFHLGADFENFQLQSGDADRAVEAADILPEGPCFLMVGTVEPRKGHSQVLGAFDVLWNKGAKINLVIVGNEGWMVDDVAKRIRTHAEYGKRLLWLEDADDGCLRKLYRNCSVLIAASEGEGFGLPLVEAARYGLPVIARDIPVFREVTGGHAFYFRAAGPSDLAAFMEEWLVFYEAGGHPGPGGVPWVTWGQSAEMLLSSIL